MKTLEAIDHIAQVVMAISILAILWTAWEQHKFRKLEEKKMHLDDRYDTEGIDHNEGLL